MKGLTLHQPWASYIATGAKKIETRGWSTRYRGPLLIHSAKKWTRRQQRAAGNLNGQRIWNPSAGLLALTADYWEAA